MIRVLHYGLSSNLGGIETYLWNLARTIDAERYHFDFLYSDTGRPPALFEEFTELGCRFHGVTPRRVSVTRNRRELAELLTPERYDLLHFHVNTASYVEPARAALRAGVPVVVHSHNAGTSRSPVTQVLHHLNSRLTPWRRVTRVAVSQEAGRWMFGRGSTFEVIPNGIDIDAFRFDPRARALVRHSLDIGSDVFVLGQVGAFLAAKNQEYSLEILREVLVSRPDALLIFVGTGALEDKVRARARQAGFGDRVRFLGRRDDVAALMSAMDALVFPSRYEGFGLVALEAQAAGLSCVVSEAVPASVLVAPTARRAALAAGPQHWAQLLLTDPAPSRAGSADVVASAGFSVQANTARVEDVYARVRPH